jgi:hypothetical protein
MKQPLGRNDQKGQQPRYRHTGANFSHAKSTATRTDASPHQLCILRVTNQPKLLLKLGGFFVRAQTLPFAAPHTPALGVDLMQTRKFCSLIAERAPSCLICKQNRQWRQRATCHWVLEGLPKFGLFQGGCWLVNNHHFPQNGRRSTWCVACCHSTPPSYASGSECGIQICALHSSLTSVGRAFYRRCNDD